MAVPDFDALEPDALARASPTRRAQRLRNDIQEIKPAARSACPAKDNRSQIAGLNDHAVLASIARLGSMAGRGHNVPAQISRLTSQP
jgi:hypothetical protein